MERIGKTSDAVGEQHRLAELLDSAGEWFCAEGGARRVSLRRGEWEVRVAGGALRLSYWGEVGLRVWRVKAWEWTGARLLVEATRRAGALRATLELTPRASAAFASETVAAAREAACWSLAETVCAHLGRGARVESARLSAGARRGEPGRYARIVLSAGRSVSGGAGRVAATGPVGALASDEADAFVASAFLWFARLGEKGSARAPRRLLVVVPRALRDATAERVALLRESLKESIEVCEVCDDVRALVTSKERTRSDARVPALVTARVPSLEELLDAAPRFVRPTPNALSETAARIVALAPEAVDVVRARHGETLRYRGLAFARVRRVMNEERAWFGVEGATKRRPLDDESLSDFLKLLGELREHRRAGAANKRHALYRAAPEAWLESMLRRDVSRLDPGLVVSPLHAQLRASRARSTHARPLDLLALRRDGRLVVIELKVAPAPALPLQGADYWLRIAAQQRAGHVARARLFGDAKISEEPPLVYLVAPMLGFHRCFDELARAVSPSVEMYRYDLNEDWRACVRVARRARVV
ncbi:MAG TPA: hypothetical protein VFX96_04205 [Pyrinomonadaceae bacterium]|nr:hypothetical protein [Pyrinomonadaceae bacterium]